MKLEDRLKDPVEISYSHNNARSDCDVTFRVDIKQTAREAIYKDLIAAVETVLDNFEYEDERYIITPQIIRLDAELRQKLAEYCGIKE